MADSFSKLTANPYNSTLFFKFCHLFIFINFPLNLQDYLCSSSTQKFKRYKNEQIYLIFALAYQRWIFYSTHCLIFFTSLFDTGDVLVSVPSGEVSLCLLIVVLLISPFANGICIFLRPWELWCNN